MDRSSPVPVPGSTGPGFRVRGPGTARRAPALVAALLGCAVLVLAQGTPEDDKERFVRQALREQSVLRSLGELSDRVGAYARELDALSAKEQEVGRVLLDHQADVQRTAREMQLARRRAEARLVGLYKTHRGSAMAYLFSASSPMDFARRYRNARFVLAADVRTIENYRARLEELRGKIAALLSGQRELHRVASEVQARRADADAARARHRAALDLIRRDQRLYVLQAQELERASGELQDRIDRLGPGSFKPLDFAALRGYLDFPAPGIVVGRFGKKVHDRFKTVTFNRGIDIQAPEGSPVRAVFDGTVQVIQEFVGYGRVVILDHGERYHTLYAHVDRVEVAKGDRVRRGQVLGTVGRAATSDDPVLHFEIRHQGKAVDPIDWLFRK